MKNIKQIIPTILILFLLISCADSQTDNNKPNKEETPKALQDDKLNIKSYSRKGNLAEQLYQELVEKTPTLKKLEEDLDAFSPKPSELNEKFELYNSKSNSYYRSANYTASTIADSMLKKKIITLIAKSQNKYSTENSEINSLLKQISQNSANLNDHHTALKIVLTLPLIQKYQEDNKPNKKEFKDLIKQQVKLISQTDSLTPKY